MGKIYAMGDTHGDWRVMQDLCKDMKEDDIVIHVGDHGINYYGDKRDILLKKKISQLNPTFICISGNHDIPVCDYPYEKISKDGVIKGEFYFESDFHNILHCPYVNTFNINDIKFLTLSGAYSVDKFYRLQNGWNWFEHEQMPTEEMKSFKKYYKNYSTDFIISHTCPKKYEPTHLFLPYIDQSIIDKKTEEFLNWVEENIEYKQWYFGHFHSNEQLWDKGYMLFNNIKEIGNI